MIEKELDRLEIFKRIIDGRMKQSKASKILGLSTRQVKRIKNDSEQKMLMARYLRR